MPKSSCQAAAESQVISAPLLVLAVHKVTEGWPVLTDWVRTAGDLYRSGYEAWREPIEVRAKDGSVLNSPMAPGCFIPTKGITRVSIILFGLVYSYKELKLEVVNNDEVQGDFARRGAGWETWEHESVGNLVTWVSFSHQKT